MLLQFNSSAESIFYKDDVFFSAGLYNQVVLMGGCMSTPPKRVKTRKKHLCRFGKRHVKISSFHDENKIITSETGCVTDFAASQFVHKDFENGKIASFRRSGASNSTYHLKQVQWHLSQVDGDGTYFILSRGKACAERHYFWPHSFTFRCMIDWEKVSHGLINQIFTTHNLHLHIHFGQWNIICACAP